MYLAKIRVRGTKGARRYNITLMMELLYWASASWSPYLNFESYNFGPRHRVCGPYWSTACTSNKGHYLHKALSVLDSVHMSWSVQFMTQVIFITGFNWTGITIHNISAQSFERVAISESSGHDILPAAVHTWQSKLLVPLAKLLILPRTYYHTMCQISCAWIVTPSRPTSGIEQINSSRAGDMLTT